MTTPADTGLNFPEQWKHATPEARDAVIATQVFLATVREIVSRIDYRPEDYRWRVEVDNTDPAGRVFVQLEHYRPDTYTGAMKWGGGGKSYLSPHMTVSEIVRRCLGAAIAYEEHEVRESFRYRGARIFGPHIDVEALVAAAGELDVRP